MKQALEQKKNIIVSTLQKFPNISQGMGRLPGSRFAVNVDEAHSSQSGEMTKSLKQVLTPSSLEEAEQEDELEMDIEDQLVAEMKSRGPQEDVSTFAFTATPKEKTLELLGHRDERGRYAPFSLYGMRQDDPTYERDKAHRLLRAFVGSRGSWGAGMRVTAASAARCRWPVLHWAPC